MSLWVRRAGRTIARGIALFGLWMVLVDTRYEPEVVTGVVVAAAGAVIGTVVTAARGEPARVSPTMLRRIYRPFVLVFTDTARVIWALVATLVFRRRIQGRLRAVRYGATAPTAEDRARRILTEWGASLAANRYAVGIDPEVRYLLIHELVETSGPLDPLDLG